VQIEFGKILYPRFLQNFRSTLPETYRQM